MDKTLIVSDLHLQGSRILPEVEKICQKHDITRVILMGDYFDQWNLTENHALFLRESKFLEKWVFQEKKYEVVCLLGNHDIPYLTGNLRHYSNTNPKVITTLKKTLFKIKAQVCIEVGGYMISHAGFAGEHQPEPWQIKPIENTPSIIQKLNDIEKHVGRLRGGIYRYGSVVWADLHELIEAYNPAYPKQIVSHSPVQKVSNFNDLWAVDTLSLTFSYHPIGDGSMLLIEDDKIKVIQTTLSSVIRNYADQWES